MQIDIKNLSYIINDVDGDKQILKNINLHIDDNEFIGIIGSSGCGKTTLIRHLNGLIALQPNCGEIIIGNFHLSDPKCDFMELRKHVGITFQHSEDQIFCDTVYNEIMFSVNNFCINQDEQTKKETIEHIKYLCNQCDLDFEQIKDVDTLRLSNGQKKKISIISILAYKPDIIILDEPFCGLDANSVDNVTNLLQQYRKQFHSTIIVVAHNLDYLARICTKIIIMKNGQIVKYDKANTIFTDINFEKDTNLKKPYLYYLIEELEKFGKHIEIDYEHEILDEKLLCKKIIDLYRCKKLEKNTKDKYEQVY